MVAAASTLTKAQLYQELEGQTEADLEGIIKGDASKADAARYILGKLMIEGNYPERIPQNSHKGINWVKTAATNGNIDALEYKTYYDIRFDSAPKLNKILSALEKVVDEKKDDNSRACNTLAEFAHA